MIKTIHVIDSVAFDTIADASACVIDCQQEHAFSMIVKEAGYYRVDIYEELID